jgi:hypothetical protein
MKCGENGNGDRYLYRHRGVLAVVGPMWRGGRGWGQFRGGELVWGGSIREVVRSCQVTVC